MKYKKYETIKGGKYRNWSHEEENIYDSWGRLRGTSIDTIEEAIELIDVLIEEDEKTARES